MIKIEYLAKLADEIGISSEQVELQELVDFVNNTHVTAGDLRSYLRQHRNRAHLETRMFARPAIGDTVVEETQALQAGITVVFLPPFSGG